MNLDSLLDPVRKLFVAKKQPSADAIAAQRKPIQDAIAQAAAARDKHLANPPDPLLASADERAKFRGRTAAFDDDIAELQQFLDALDQREQEARARETAAAQKKARADLAQRVADVDQSLKAYLEAICRTGLPLLREFAELQVEVERFNAENPDDAVAPPGRFRDGVRLPEETISDDEVNLWTYAHGDPIEVKNGSLTVTKAGGNVGTFLPNGGQAGSMIVELKPLRPAWGPAIGSIPMLHPHRPTLVFDPGDHPTSRRIAEQAARAIAELENPPPPEEREIVVKLTPITALSEVIRQRDEEAV